MKLSTSHVASVASVASWACAVQTLLYWASLTDPHENQEGTWTSAAIISAPPPELSGKWTLTHITGCAGERHLGKE